jgi:hypothetical protein
MKTLSFSSDKMAISLSFLCVLHCLTVPLLVAILPSLAVMPLEQETFHFGMVIAVIPISIYALTLGCKKHKTLSVVITGLFGLTLLATAVMFGESHLGEKSEKVLTIVGALLVALSHYQNYSRCQKLEQCPCPHNNMNENL